MSVLLIWVGVIGFSACLTLQGADFAFCSKLESSLPIDAFPLCDDRLAET